MRQTKESFNIKMDDGIFKMDNGLVAYGRLFDSHSMMVRRRLITYVFVWSIVNLSIGYQPCTNELMINKLVTNDQ